MISNRSPHPKSKKDLKIGILGSGLMGHGIAYVSALSGMEVVMTDISQSQLDSGLGRIKEIFIDSLNKGFITEKRMHKALSNINATADYSELTGCNLIIEAVYENRELKTEVIAKTEKYLSPDGIFASNTSTILITRLAEKSIQPEKFVGIHFFSPVHKMKLVEIIKGKKTNLETIDKAVEFVTQISKVPIIVNDSSGFYTTRVFERYTREGMALLAEGNSAEHIELAAEKAGFPVGPLAVIDEINIELVKHIRGEMSYEQKAGGKELPLGPWDQVINLMINKVNRTGRSGNGGFYEYPKNGKKFLWSGLQKYFPLSKNQLSIKEMIDRFYFSQAIESIRCYEENVITSAKDANVGSVLGWGFPSKKGGTLQFVNDYGLINFRNRSQELADKYGERFNPPKLLEKMVEKGEIF